MDYTTQYINDRSKLWTPSIEKILRKWRKQICIRQKGHVDQERRCLRKYQLISLPSIFVSSIVSTAIFSTFEDCPDGEVCSKKWIRLTSGILNVIGTIFLGINSLYNFQESASKHKSSSDSYNELLRLIDSTLSTPTQFRGDAVAILQHIKSRYDDIIKSSESLSEEFTTELEYAIKKDGSETSSEQHDKIEHCDDSSGDNHRNVIPLKKNLRSPPTLEKINVSDDETEVHLSFDIDEIHPPLKRDQSFIFL
jgi:hypothetical protein